MLYIIEIGSEVSCVSYMPEVYKISMMRMSKMTDENCEVKGLNEQYVEMHMTVMVVGVDQ